MRAVIRSPFLQKHAARLALVAMLLLAALPTLGRLAQHVGENDSTGWVAMCTSMGLKYVDIAPAAHDHGSKPAPAHPHDGMDCDYCPLLAHGTLLSAAPMLLQPLVPAMRVSWSWTQRPGGVEPILSANPRGPPSLLEG
jgi:hypothetical protein